MMFRFNHTLANCAVILGLCSALTSAQLPERVEKCLPNPTLAQEIRDMQPVPRTIRLHVVNVQFDPSDAMPAELRQAIVTEIQKQVFIEDLSANYLREVAREIANVHVHEPLQERGYFRALADAKATTLREEGLDEYISVKISATPGPQYRLSNLEIRPVVDSAPLKIPAQTLRRLLPLATGELLDTGRLRTGLKNMTRAYGALGYIDMTAEPDFEFHDANNTIDVALTIDEQAPYRAGSIAFLGVDSTTQDKLKKTLPSPGETFDSSKLERFFVQNRKLLPADASRDDVTLTRDVQSRTVNVSIDLRTCPQ